MAANNPRWMEDEMTKDMERALSGKQLGLPQKPNLDEIRQIAREQLTHMKHTLRERRDYTHDEAFTTLAALIAEEIFQTIEHERRVVKGDFIEAAAKILALSRWRHVRKGEL